jgi:VanZ family protein
VSNKLKRPKQEIYPPPRPSLKLLARNWWPVAVWLGIIRLESTEYASASNTFSLLYRACTMIFGRVDPRLIFAVDEVGRKCGHFIGYAILSALVLLALKRTCRDRWEPVVQRSWGVFLRDIWRIEWAVIAFLVTIATASLDEIHQTFLPSRTGRWQDVIIDTSGALLTQILIYVLSARAKDRRRRSSVEEPEASLTH